MVMGNRVLEEGVGKRFNFFSRIMFVIKKSYLPYLKILFVSRSLTLFSLFGRIKKKKTEVFVVSIQPCIKSTASLYPIKNHLCV